MKKLNRKGFTLIELLAVIVVLAIVLVVTIPSVISSMNSAKDKQFNNAVATIQEYLTKQKEMCSMKGSGLIDESNYNKDLFETGTCDFIATSNDKTKDNFNGVLAIEGAGYTIDTGTGVDFKAGDFTYVKYGTDGKITGAESGEGSQFGAQSWSK